MERSTGGVRRLAYILDEMIRIPGTNARLGMDAILGLVPVGGDMVGGVLSAYILVFASRLGAPPSVLIRMAGNILVDTIVGSIPFLGDLFDVGWKSNRRNVALLDEFIAAPRRVTRTSQLVLVLILLFVGLLTVMTAWLSVRFIRWILRSL